MGPLVFPIDPSSQQTPPSLPAAGGRQQGPSSAEISGEHHPAVAIALPLLLAFYLPGPPSVSGRWWPAVSACDPHVKKEPHLIYLCLVSYHMISSSKHDSIFNFSVNYVLLKTENLIFFILYIITIILLRYSSCISLCHCFFFKNNKSTCYLIPMFVFGQHKS